MKNILFLSALFLFGGVVFGQTSAARATNTEVKVFALELGTGVAYDLAAKASNATQTVSAVFGLNDVVQAAFVVLKGDTAARSYNLVRVGVTPITDITINLEFGSTGSAAIASGLGLGYTLFRNSSGGLVTALQGGLAYRFTDPASGSLAFGFNLKVGI